MQVYSIFKDLAIILVAAKCLGMLARKMNVPQVVGEIIAGLIIGPAVLGLVGGDAETMNILKYLGEIGVILLMFSAGLGTNLKNLIKTGPLALAIACAGVFVPLAAGTLMCYAFYGASAIGTPDFYKAVFIGTIMTATSVSITVKTLEELGKLKSKIGTTIVSAAIIDDVIGIIVLTVVVGMGGGEQQNTWLIIAKSLGFFLFSGAVGVIAYKLFAKMSQNHEHNQRIPIFGLALCFFFSYIAEAWFGVADITGAFAAGVILCSLRNADYIERKMEISSYMMFGPVFFASIGLKTDISGVDGALLWFSVCFILVALAGKIIGCGLVGRLCRNSFRDSMIIGVGMMTRGEVALIVAQKGLNCGLLEPRYFTPVILLIITSSVITPILLKLLYGKPEQNCSGINVKI